MNKKLRLLITPDCNRNCPQCCNKNFDLDALPQIAQADEFKKYDEIALTGGEPLLVYDKLRETIMYLREYGDYQGPLHLYTAMPGHEHIVELAKITNLIITIHDKNAMIDMLDAWTLLEKIPIRYMRVKLAPAVHQYYAMMDNLLYGCDVECFDWIEDCPLPGGEDFMRI